MKHEERQLKLFILPTGGLANRMRAIAGGVALSKVTGRRPVILWHKDSGINADYEDLYHLNPELADIKRLSDFEYNWLYDLPRKKNLHLSPLVRMFDRRKWIFHHGAHAAEMEEDYFEANVKNTGKDVVVMSCYAFYYNDMETLRSLFQPSEIIIDRKKEILGGRHPDIAVQIRRTDNTWSIENSPVELFKERIESEIEKNKNINIFLATDDQIIKQELYEQYPGNIFFNPTPARRDTLQGMIDAVAEMEIMGDSEIIYGSYSSSFSELAALKGDKKLIVLKK